MSQFIKLTFKDKWLQSSWNMMWRWQPEFPIDFCEGQIGEEFLADARTRVSNLGASLKLRPDLPDKRGPRSVLWTEAAVIVPEEQHEVILALLDLDVRSEASPLAELFTLKSLRQFSGDGAVSKGRGGHTARTLTRAKMSGDVAENQDGVNIPVRAIFAKLNLG